MGYTNSSSHLSKVILHEGIIHESLQYKNTNVLDGVKNTWFKKTITSIKEVTKGGGATGQSANQQSAQFARANQTGAHLSRNSSVNNQMQRNASKDGAFM